MLRWGSISCALLLLFLMDLSTPWTPAPPLLPLVQASPSFSSARKKEMRDLIRNTWQHGFDAYMRAAFPQDELLPLSCQGQGHDHTNPADIARNDVCGDYALTLVDGLDSFAVFGDHRGFAAAVQQVIDTVSFDKPVRIQVFEATIRIMGGLLSAHNFATEPKYGFAPHLPWYQDQLLALALDLGHRMLPAFTNSQTGMPYSRINLKTGQVQNETHETCAAAAGSLMLEFAALSRLSGDPVFEHVARKAMSAVWEKRSPLDLLGNSINMQNGHWLYAQSSIGAGVDSIFEYMVKTYVMLGEEDFWDMWEVSYQAVNTHLRAPNGFWHRGVHMLSGNIMSNSVDSLSAFWPGLQVLAGDVEGAVKTHQLYANIWRRYSGLPESYSMPRRQADIKPYPLRPELIESTLLLYSATNDDSYLHFGERVVRDIVNRTRVECGLAGIQDVETGELEDRMHSFALSETLKYAYLIFDERTVLNLDDTNMVYTTEGHPLTLPRDLSRPSKALHQSEADSRTCPIYAPNNSSRHWSPMLPSVDHRVDAHYVRFLAGLYTEPEREIATGQASIYGFCEKPDTDSEMIDLLFGYDEKLEDADPSEDKVQRTKEGLLVHSIENLRLLLAPRHFDTPASSLRVGQYDIVKLGPHTVSPKSTVTITDPMVWQALNGAEPTTRLAFISAHGHLGADGIPAVFGPGVDSVSTVWKSDGSVIDLLAVPGGSQHQLGCEPYTFDTAAAAAAHGPRLVFVRRGLCSFFHKAKMAAQAGADGIIIANTDEGAFTPSADASEMAMLASGEATVVPLLMVNNSTSRVVERMLAGTEKVKVKTGHGKPERQKLVINGYAIANAVVQPRQP